MADNPEDFKQFIESLQINRTFKISSKWKIDFEDFYQHKEEILKSSQELLNNKNYELKSEFELISPNWTEGKHWIIWVSGFLSEEDDNKISWEGLIQNYYGNFLYNNYMIFYLSRGKYDKKKLVNFNFSGPR